jgi:HK97 family phage major capsid protein
MKNYLTSKRFMIHLAILAVMVLAVHFLGGGSHGQGPLMLGMTIPAGFYEEMSGGLKTLDAKMGEYKTDISGMRNDYEALRKQNAELVKHVNSLRTRALANGSGAMIRPGAVVSDECAKYLGAVFVKSAHAQGKLKEMDSHKRDLLLKMANEVFTIEQKALDTGDVPMPVEYGNEIIELTYKYGQARQFMTRWPMGTGTTKLPKLSTDPAFGFMDMSAAIPEKRPQAAFVTFTAHKCGGIIRVPSEIDFDSMFTIGQWLARYCARNFARWEDTTAFLGDGSATYALISGVGKTADTLGKKVTLGATKTAPTDATIEDIRALRAVVDSAALFESAYYMNPTWESYLASLNDSKYGRPYQVSNGLQGPTLDGFPIRWVGVMPVYGATAAPSTYPIHFGAMNYWFMGERGQASIDYSREVFFAGPWSGLTSNVWQMERWPR